MAPAALIQNNLDRIIVFGGVEVVPGHLPLRCRRVRAHPHVRGRTGSRWA